MFFTLAAFMLTAAFAVTPEEGSGLMQKYGCAACHEIDRPLVGPSYKAIAARYRMDTQAQEKLFLKIKNGGAGVWGEIPMPPNPNISDQDIQKLLEWMLGIQ
jgi:cytochrome c